MFDYCKKKYFLKHIDKGEKKNIMKPQSHRKGSSLIAKANVPELLCSWHCEPETGYETSRRLRFFVAVCEVFFYYKKERRWSGMDPTEVCIFDLLKCFKKFLNLRT